MPRRRDDKELRRWAIEQAVKLATARPDTEPPAKVEEIAERLVDYVEQGEDD